MRKEVKRSLVIWPSIASTAIVGMSYLPGFVNPTLDIVSKSIEHQNSVRLIATQTWQNLRAQWVTDPETTHYGESPRAEFATAMHRSVTAPDVTFDIVERADQGSRAMKLPPRLNFVLGSAADDGTLLAPVVDVRQELAGLGLQLPSTEPVPSPTVGQSLRIETAKSSQPSESVGAIGTTESAERSAPVASTIRPPTAVSQTLGRESTMLPTSVAVLAKVAPVLNPPLPLLNLPAKATTSEDWSDQRLHPSEVEAIIESLQLSSSNPNAESDRPGSLIHRKPYVMLQSPIEPTVAVEKRPEKTPILTLPPVGNPASWPLTSALHDQLLSIAGGRRGTDASQQLYVSLRNSLTSQFVSASKEYVGSASIVDGTSGRDPGGEDLDVAWWAYEAADVLHQLQSLERLGDPRAGALLSELDRLARLGIERAEQLQDPEEKRRCLCAAYAINRRTAVWKPVWQVTQGAGMSAGIDPDFVVSGANIQTLIQAVEVDLLVTDDPQGWRRFLLLDELNVAAKENTAVDRAILAQRFLSRLAWHALDRRHVAWLQRPSIVELSAAIRPWTRQAINYAELLQEIEQQESDEVESVGNHVAAAVQSLRFANQSHLSNVADAIDTHYRNANLRVAISAELLNRLLPKLPPETVPVRTTVLGNQVRGISHVDSDLELMLHPAPDRWSVSLKTFGSVRTDSTGFSGPVALRTAGTANFTATTPIGVSTTGIQIGQPQVVVQGNTRLRNVRSKYDNVPLVSELVRNIAASRYESMSPLSNRIANDRMSSQIGETIDETIEQRLAEATDRLQSAVLNPLARLQLNPKVIDLQTTDERLLARYRLAGDWQLAAFTPRPRAPHASLMSLQVHESAINNALEQLLPASAEKTVDALIRDAALTLGASQAFAIEDIPDDLTIQFSKTAPISIDIEDGLLWVTMRVLRLNRGDKMRLNRLIVRAAYRPEVNGNQIALVRDGHLRISGVGMSMRERLPARAIFNKVFSPTRIIPLILPQISEHDAVKELVITQLELRDGWIAMALGHPHHERIALAAQASPANSHK